MTFLVLVGCRGATPFDFELWPGEGIPRFAAKTDRLSLYEQPSRSSLVVATHPINKGEEIAYSATRLRTIRPGLVTATEPKQLSGRSFGSTRHLSVERYYSLEPRSKQLSYKTGASFEYLQARAEGNCLIRDHGVVLEIEGCPWLEGGQGSGFKVIEKPVTEWWIRAEGKDRQPLGWLLVDEETVEFLPRAF